MSDRQRLFEVCCSCCIKSISEEKLRSMEIDKRLAEDKSNDRRYRCKTFMNLLLGGPGSGKSTFLKQANFLFGKDFNNNELSEFRPIIYGDILQRMKVLAYARRKLKLEWQDPSNQQHEDNILNFRAPQHIDTDKFMSYLESIKSLLADKAIQDVYAGGVGRQLGESSEYFFQHLDRVGHPEYFPTKMDAHYAKAAEGVSGVTRHEFDFDHFTFSMMHIGERRFSSHNIKWKRFPCFANVECILFFVPCITYDQFPTDGTTNCLVESCNLFDRIINNRFLFNDALVILLFTKADLLEEKIKHSNIKEYFPEFQGDPRKLQDVQGCISRMFDDRQQGNSLFCGHHFISTNDPENISLLFHIIRRSYYRKGVI